MKYILLIGIILLSFSCMPCKRLARKCPIIAKDSIVYTEIVKFDTILLVSPADTLFLSIPVEPDLNVLTVDASNRPGPSVKIKIKDRILTATVVCPEDSLKAVINSLQTELINQTTKVEYRDKDVVRNSKFARVCIIFTLCALILFAVWVYLKIKGGVLKSLIPRL